jgi:hypothetical protein
MLNSNLKKKPKQKLSRDLKHLRSYAYIIARPMPQGLGATHMQRNIRKAFKKQILS